MNIIEVEEALQIILAHTGQIATHTVPIEDAYGCVLAENMVADRDFPPFDRVTMDGIAIGYNQFEGGKRTFETEKIHMAGDPIYTLKHPENAVEVMTGAILPIGTDTVVRYEDLTEIENGFLINSTILRAQNVHKKGSDKKANDILLAAPCKLDAMQLAIAATVGKSSLLVYKPLKVAIISTGDELMAIDAPVAPHQIRRSNGTAISALLKPYPSHTHLFHLKDNIEHLEEQLRDILSSHDVLILSGGVSMGKKDFVPQVLKTLGVSEHFHKIKQKPGKPMWFGTKDQKTVFALPGNPTSTIVCMLQYVLPWFSKQYGLPHKKNISVKLGTALSFKPELQHFVQGKLTYINAETWVQPILNNGSGDFANLSSSDGFIVFPNRKNRDFERGEILQFICF